MPQSDLPQGPHASEVQVLWPTHVERIPITSDLGGWEPPSFHHNLAKEAVRGWRAFKKNVVPSLPAKHFIREQAEQRHAGAINDAFFHWQKSLFESKGDVQQSLVEREDPLPTPPADANSSWPEMDALPEYGRLRRIVERLSRRYLVRSGMARSAAHALNFSIFNWAAVHKPGEFHGPHTHVGEYNVGVFYAQVGPSGGKLRFGDPRGTVPPFGREHVITPRAGELVLFPSWLSHMATVTAATSDLPKDYDREPLRVVFSFNIGPSAGPLPCDKWWSDPTSDMRFGRSSAIDPRGLGLD